jgi:hypothetical protein
MNPQPLTNFRNDKSKILDSYIDHSDDDRANISWDRDTPVVMKCFIFWDITPRSTLKVNGHFWGTKPCLLPPPCWLILRPLRIRRIVPPRVLTFYGLHTVTSHKTNPTNCTGLNPFWEVASSYVPKLLKNIPNLYGTVWPTTASRINLQFPLSWTRSIHSITSYHVSVRSVLILSSCLC